MLASIRLFRSLPLFAAIVLSVQLESASAGAADTAACLTGSDPAVSGDAADIAALEAAIETGCPCASYDGSDGYGRADYRACVSPLLRAALDTDALRSQCYAAVKKAYKFSSCGAVPADQQAPCVRLSENGKVTCRIRTPGKCQSKAGSYAASLCPAWTRCVDAADDSGDYLVSSSDSGSCITTTTTLLSTTTEAPTTTTLPVCTASPVNPPNGSYENCIGVSPGIECSLACDAGYTQAGPNPTCIDHADWSGSPTCEPDPCLGPPAPVDHGSYAGCASVASGSACPLTCDLGYLKAGTEQTCSLGIYSGPAPTCEAASCTASPPNPTDGTYASCAGTPSGGSCALTCGPGHTRSGANPTCLTGTSWSGSPTCEPDPCTHLPLLNEYMPGGGVHGQYPTSCLPAPSSSYCDAQCDYGWYETGAEPECYLGSWAGIGITCNPDYCPAITNPVGGTYEDCTTKYHGQTCHLTCGPGRHKVGSDPTCDGGASWIGALPSCDEDPCLATPAPPPNGSYPDCASPPIPSGTECTLSCDPGYHRVGTAPATCYLGFYTSNESCDPD